MAISRAMAADLCALAEATAGEDGIDLRASLDDLCRTADVVVRCFLGVTLAVDHPAGRVTVTALQPGAGPTAVASSLHLALSQLGGPPGSTLTLYAGVPGAFDLLADDLERLCRQHGTVLVCDIHLSVPADADRDTVAQLSVVNQALGILIAQGWTLEDARAELCRGAIRDGAEVPIAAQRLVQSVAGGRACD